MEHAEHDVTHTWGSLIWNSKGDDEGRHRWNVDDKHASEFTSEGCRWAFIARRPSPNIEAIPNE